MKIYAFQWTSCVYESAFFTVSLHKTRLGAYKAMRGMLLEEWESNFKIRIHGEKLEADTRYFRLRGGDHPLEFERWKVVTMEVLE
jgi:hypothetical protein